MGGSGVEDVNRVCARRQKEVLVTNVSKWCSGNEPEGTLNNNRAEEQRVFLKSKSGLMVFIQALAVVCRQTPDQKATIMPQTSYYIGRVL